MTEHIVIHTDKDLRILDRQFYLEKFLKTVIILKIKYMSPKMKMKLKYI